VDEQKGWYEVRVGAYTTSRENADELAAQVRAALSRPQGRGIHPEDSCQRCGGPNVSWFASNALWNKVVGSPNGIWCPLCFIRAAEAAGVKPPAWEVRPEEPPPSPPMDRQSIADRQLGEQIAATYRRHES
jgi:hypothetical protein